MTSNTNLTVTGIDLGSSSTKIAAVMKGGVQIITNQANFRQTPNIVAFGPYERLIGQSGQLKIKSNFLNTVTAPSRFLGFNSDCPYLQQELKFCPAKTKITQNPKSLTFDLIWKNQRQGFTTQQLVASYLTEMEKIIAYTNNLCNKNLVISVPTYFTQHERQALMDAVQIAKKKLSNQYAIQLVNQEIAISMDYGYPKRNEFSKNLQQAHKVLFIDFGHSKTNVFVTAYNKQNFKVIANKFDRQLGCKFLDQETFNFYAHRFDSDHPNLQLYLMESKKAVIKLLENIEKQRKVLSGNLDHDLNIECLLENEDFSYSMNRQNYEKICQPVIQKFKNLLKSFSEELKEKGISFDVIELIGGGTRIPAIIKAISQVFESEPCRTINSNECVARGGALISAINSSIFKVQPYFYFTISPYCIEVKINGQALGKNLVNKNELIMSEKSIEFDISGLGNKFILSGEYSSENLEQGLEKKIFECLVNLESKIGKKQNESSEMKQQEQEAMDSKLIIKFSFDNSGLIKLQKIKPLDSQKSVQISNLNYFPKFSLSELAHMEIQQKQMTLRDFKIKKFYQKKNQFESVIYKNKRSLEALINSNSQHVSQQKANQIYNYLDYQLNWLNTDLQISSDIILDQFSAKQTQMNQKMDQFTDFVNQIKESYLLVNQQLQKLSNLINEIISKRNPQMYPDEVNKVGEWINQVFESLKSSSKSAPPIVSRQKIKSVYEQLIKKMKEFDMEVERQRQINMKREREQRRNQGDFNRQRKTSQNRLYSGRQNEEKYQKKRSPRNETYRRNRNPLGSFFGSGFSSFF